MTACPFCLIVAGEAPATKVAVWLDAIAIKPIGPVVPGHVLVIPRLHVKDLATDPIVTASVMARAAELAARIREESGNDINLITSAGPAATQTVLHLHIHLVPRRAGDGLALPWTSQTRVPLGA